MHGGLCAACCDLAHPLALRLGEMRYRVATVRLRVPWDAVLDAIRRGDLHVTRFGNRHGYRIRRVDYGYVAGNAGHESGDATVVRLGKGSGRRGAGRRGAARDVAGR